MRRLRYLLAALGTICACTAGAASAAPGDNVFVDTSQIIGDAEFTTEEGGTVSSTAFTVPNWAASFTYGGVTYPYSMVGTNPASGAVTTTVKTAIIPIDLNFKAGVGGSLKGSDRVAATLASPIFQTTDFSTLRNVYALGFGYLGDQAGPPVTSQYGNAVHKAMFWQTGGSASGYNVLLDPPTVYPAQTIDVPQNQGFDLLGTTSGQHFARVSYSWMSSRVHNLLVSLKVPADVLPMFVTDSTFLFLGDRCCVIGYHGATSNAGSSGKNAVNTYLYAAYSAPGIFSSPAIADIHALSHEVSEWYADPFVNNHVPPFFARGYGCLSDLETGDPVVGSGFQVSPVGSGTTYNPEDEVFYSWFARETPSRGFLGRYSFTANPSFTSVSTGC